ncbi:hypothetical protein Ae717Ps2_7102c [Pseudonocardia sp. Ae717_Ps2]|uniref:hypothetical protein n=1 Tax=Pseudonocardia sp. Ae717_Ps2 TaxID=1885573 RepID=UPI00094B480B|nr:hypothetical protein [Pseudonocardia sp. Ae717_Ps2]OLM27884.1 hypothetical protein Ae717Ps2_7102c [Pseudonocardia sp. Ae717_Ps2]
MSTENRKTTMESESESELVSFPFGPGSMRRFQAGTKRAAVVPAAQAVLLGTRSSLVARSSFGDARLPLQVIARHDLPAGLDGLPKQAEAVGLTLADFTSETQWSSYIEMTRENVPGAAVLLVMEPTGPMTGTLYNKKKKTWGGLGALAWYRVDLELLAPPAAPIYSADQETLAARITTVLDHLAPAAETREAAEAVVEVLLQSGRAHGKITPELTAALGHTRVNAAVDWLRRNKLLVGLARERVWSPRLLVGLRVRIPVSQAGDRTPEPDRPPPARR